MAAFLRGMTAGLSREKWLLSLVSAGFAGLRIGGITSEPFQAFAHIWVGFLIGAWAARRDDFYLTLILAISLIELVVALHQRKFF